MSDVSFTGGFSLAQVCADTFRLCTFSEVLGDGISPGRRGQLTRCQPFCAALTPVLLERKVNLSMKSLCRGNQV